MGNIEWKLPVPSTALLGAGPTFVKRSGREVGLGYSYEDDTGERSEMLVFEGVEAFACTYQTALNSESLSAYDAVEDRGKTSWLTEVGDDIGKNGAKPAGLRHLMITFDDGPCYEFLCRGFRVE